MYNFFSALRDIVIALLRLIMLLFILFFTGLNHILFNRTEISNVSLVIIPQRRDRERLAFVDDLKQNNFDLLKNSPLPPASCNDFKDDEHFDEEDFDIEDFPDDDEDDDNNDNSTGEDKE